MAMLDDLKKKLEYAISAEGRKESSEFLGLPDYERMLERSRSGQPAINPLEVMGMIGRPIESVTAAPARAAISSLQGNLDLGEAMTAFANQFGRNPSLAPTGAQIAERAGLQGKAAAAAGLGLDIAIDPTNLMGGAALKAVPLIGLAGTMAKASKAQPVGRVLAKQDPLGFYSKLEDVILSKMGKSATPEQVMSIAKGAKEEEVAGSGLAEFLKGKEKVSQEEVLQQIRENRPQLKESIKGNTPEQAHLQKLQKNLRKAEQEFFVAANKEGIKRDHANDILITLNHARDTADADKLFQSLPETLKPLASRFKELYSQREAVANLARNSAKPELKPLFAQYQEPGGENYREVLFTYKPQPDKAGLAARKEIFDKYQPQIDAAEQRSAEAPSRYSAEALQANIEADALRAERDAKADAVYAMPEDNQFKSSHWSEPNVLAHARVNERVDEAGKKLLHVEEIQSDWHQKGREVGYQGASDKALEELYAQRESLERKMDELRKNLRSNSPRSGAKADFDAAKSEWDRLGSEILKIKPKDASSVVPDAPFKKSWMELMAKRLIRQAVDSGADRMSWTPGAKQAARYDLSKQISRIEYEPYGANAKGESLYELSVYDKKGNQVYSSEDLNINDVKELVGKDMAKKIEAKEGRSLKSERPNRPDWMSLEGLDLEVGGEGMKGFYDKMLPDFLRKFGKKYDAEVGETTTNGMKVPFLELTPALKKAVKEEGLPLFKVGVSAGMPALMEKMRRDTENSD